MATTALEIIRQTASEVGEYGAYTTTALGSATTLVSSQLVNSNLEATELEDVSVLLETGSAAGESRHVRRSGFAKATGTITTADAFSAAVEAGVRFSLYGRLGPFRTLNVRGLLECANDGLRALSVQDTLTMAGVSGQRYYPIDTDQYPWLTEGWRVIAVEHPQESAQDARTRIPPVAWRWRASGEQPELCFAWEVAQTGQTFGLRVYRPANSRLRLTATARATVAAGAVTSVTVTGGGYYLAVPTITVTGGGGTGCVLTPVLSGTTLASVTVTNGGTGYTAAPAVTVSAGAWADQTSQSAGLRTLGDQTAADLASAVVATKAEVYRTLAEVHAPGALVVEWLAKAAEADQRVARMVQTTEKDRLSGLASLRPTLVGGGLSGWSGQQRRSW